MGSGPASLIDRLGAAWQRRAVTLKAASFASVGVVNTLVDLCAFLFFYTVLHLSLIPANIVAWLIAVSGSYVMNCFITFAVESGRRLRWRDYGAFVASGIAGVIANTATLWGAINWLSLHVFPAKLLAIGVSFAVNFSLSHFVVFRPRT